MKEKSPCQGSNPDLLVPDGYFQISWTPTKTGAKQQLVQHGILTVTFFKLQPPKKI
jgi:hypothetical protein